MNEFKTGDRVKHVRAGYVGTVVGTSNTGDGVPVGNHYDVKWDGASAHPESYVSGVDLELISAS